MWLIVHSPFGKALQAIRDNETRARFVGIRIQRYRFIAFLVSGVFTGIAGALWVPLNGLTTPDILYWPFSGEIVFMTVLGGFRNFTGPIVGAVVYNYRRPTPPRHRLLAGPLGIVLVVLVVTLPTGIGHGCCSSPGCAGVSRSDDALETSKRPISAHARRDKVDFTIREGEVLS
jgi:branched-chain amino acid transport system permease protein